MSLTRTTSLRLLKIGGIILIAFIIIGYSVWRTHTYIEGPAISIFEPVNGSALASSTVTVRGQALRVNIISINGNVISVDQEGNFTENIVLFPGLNILTITAQDQFKRHTEKRLTIMGLHQFPTVKATIGTSTDRIIPR